MAVMSVSRIRPIAEGTRSWNVGPLELLFEVPQGWPSIVDALIGRGPVVDSWFGNERNVERPVPVCVRVVFDPQTIPLDAIDGVRIEALEGAGDYRWVHPCVEGELYGIDDTETPMGTSMAVRAPAGVRQIGGFVGSFRAATRALCAVAMPWVDGLLIHGCGLAVPSDDESAVLFVGPSGVGKSTLVQRLPHWPRLADDTCVVWREPTGEWRVSGTPFPGKERLDRSGASRRLTAIVRLEPHAPQLQLTPSAPGEGLANLLESVVLPLSSGPAVDRVFDLSCSLSETVWTGTLASSLEDDLGLLEGRAW